MVVVGNSSAAIAAASHVTWYSINSSKPDEIEQDNTTNLKDSDGLSNYELENDLIRLVKSRSLREIPENKDQGKLKWGVVSENVAIIDVANGEERPVGQTLFVWN